MWKKCLGTTSLAIRTDQVYTCTCLLAIMQVQSKNNHVIQVMTYKDYMERQNHGNILDSVNMCLAPALCITTNLHCVKWVPDDHLPERLIQLELCGTWDGIGKGEVLSQYSCLRIWAYYHNLGVKIHCVGRLQREETCPVIYTYDLLY